MYLTNCQQAADKRKDGLVFERRNVDRDFANRFSITFEVLYCGSPEPDRVLSLSSFNEYLLYSQNIIKVPTQRMIGQRSVSFGGGGKRGRKGRINL